MATIGGAIVAPLRCGTFSDGCGASIHAAPAKPFPYPFLFLFFAAVMASAWIGETGAGLFAVLLSTVAVEYFFVPPFYSFAINTTDTAYFVAFVFCALARNWVSSSKKRSEEAL